VERLALDAIEVAREGADIAIAFNAKYLADALNAIDAEGVALEMTEPLRPGVIRPVGGNRPAYLCVLMPMQVI
jgi:DNA polymerase-3 subunit beta